MAVSFRPAEPSDAETVARYHHRCWQVAFTPLLEPGAVERVDPWRMLDVFRWWFTPESEMTTVVADLDGRPIGHTTVSGAELVHLFVDPDHAGRGLGRALLAVAEELLAASGHREAELHTIVGNAPALALYRSAGWVVTERVVHNDLGDGVVYDEHVLVKRLAE